MPGGGGIAMALRMTCLAGLLMFSNVQAGDIADGSTNHGFLSKYMQLRSESSNRKSYIGDQGKFMAHHLNRMEHGGRPEALSDHYVFVEGTSKNFKPQKIADNMENTDVQKVLSNESNKPIGFSIIAVAVALLSLAAMVGVRMRRRMQPAIALASSSGHGIDMSIPLTTVSANNTLDLWDPLGLGEGAHKAHVKNFRGSELQHGQVATIAVFFVSTSPHAFVLPARNAPPAPTKLHALNPEMSGAIEKAKNPEGYEAIVRQTMEKENCDYDEAVARYNQYLFDPDGYSIMKRNEQLRAKGYNNMEEYIIAEKGQAAWDEIQKNAEEEKQKKQYTSFIVVGALFGVFLAVKPYVLQM